MCHRARHGRDPWRARTDERAPPTGISPPRASYRPLLLLTITTTREPPLVVGVRHQTPTAFVGLGDGQNFLLFSSACGASRL